LRWNTKSPKIDPVGVRNLITGVGDRRRQRADEIEGQTHSSKRIDELLRETSITKLPILRNQTGSLDEGVTK
jgi:hypothetical protein